MSLKVVLELKLKRKLFKNIILESFPLFVFINTASGKMEENQIPLVRTGSARVYCKFYKPLPSDNLFQMFYAGCYPSICSIDKKRRITLSYRTS